VVTDNYYNIWIRKFGRMDSDPRIQIGSGIFGSFGYPLQPYCSGFHDSCEFFEFSSPLKKAAYLFGSLLWRLRRIQRVAHIHEVFCTRLGSRVPEYYLSAHAPGYARPVLTTLLNAIKGNC